MSGRRPMAAMLAEMAEGVMAAAATAGVRATRMEVTLPVEIGFTSGEFAAELPRFITRTSFDAPPSRLHLVWEAQP
jgi:hypothetical protein